MQAAKDTFLKTLAGRLATVNPARTVTLDGSARPAVLAIENETPLPANTLLEVFLLSWEAASHAESGGGLMYADCKVSYASKGTSGMEGSDRGRILTAMETELLQITEPRQAGKIDYAQNPPAPLGTNIFWTRPVMAAEHDSKGVLGREATVRVFFFPEVG